MRVVVYPADMFGCGHFRLIWATELLRSQGHDVEVLSTHERQVELVLEGEIVRDVRIDADVVVFQRVTHQWIAQAVSVLRAKGVAVVVDIDDDLNSIHPKNPAWESMHPRNYGRKLAGGQTNRHSWSHLNMACRDATLVTVSTPALLDVYARHGRGQVIPNYLPDMYYNVPHEDSDTIGWPASLHSHPDDPSAVGWSVQRLVSDGSDFRVCGDPKGTGSAFSLPQDAPGEPAELRAWPAKVAELGIGIAPLADTRFNRAKSWLKPLEMSALGVPWVASPRAEYVRLNQLGAGVLADHPRRWYRELSALRASAGLRQEHREKNRAVADTLRLRDHSWRWMEAWERAHSLQHSAHSIVV